MPSLQRRIGVVGVGFGAQVYVPGLQSEGWEVAAVCSRNRDKAAKVAQAAGIPDVHTDAMELIQRNDLAAVAITTPPRAHRELSIAALKAGKHVLCEKPFAMDATEAAAMRDAAEASGRTAMVGHEFRHTPQRAYIKQLLAEGYIGQFQLCTIELFLDRYVTAQPRPFAWMALKSEGGGVLGALGSHYIDGLRHWFGDVASVSGHLAVLRPDVVDTATNRIVKSETDDTFVFTLQFKNGGIATMSSSFAATPARGAKIAVMGDKGIISRLMRAARNGNTPPACAKTNRASRQRANVPVSSRLVMARVVSNGNSSEGTGMSGSELQSAEAVGWKKTTILRRLNSSNTGASRSSPG